MEYEQFLKIIEFHELSTKLKKTLRQGWVKWHLEGERIESVADHIFGVCMLAVGIISTLQLDLDTNKVITMIMLHETEEILIGDITFLDDAAITKKEEGRKAVLKILGDFPNSQHFLSLIEEFEENKTKEARFVNQCDKFEADLQARLYEKNFNCEKVSSKLTNHPLILEHNKQGFHKVCEYFLQTDKQRFCDEFLQMANFLERLEKSEK